MPNTKARESPGLCFIINTTAMEKFLKAMEEVRKYNLKTKELLVAALLLEMQKITG